jgi:hypothetical protein
VQWPGVQLCAMSVRAVSCKGVSQCTQSPTISTATPPSNAPPSPAGRRVSFFPNAVGSTNQSDVRLQHACCCQRDGYSVDAGTAAGDAALLCNGSDIDWRGCKSAPEPTMATSTTTNYSFWAVFSPCARNSSSILPAGDVPG